MKLSSISKLSRQEDSEKKHFDSLAEGYDYKYHYSKLFTQYKLDKKRQRTS